MPAGAAAELVVPLDDVPADGFARVGVDPERPDVELPPQGSPDDALVDRNRVERVEVRDLPAAHRRRSSSSTTGSIRSMPSTRSSRFSVPAHSANVVASSPS